MSTYAITGAASGIGAATRQRLVDAGHTVIGVDLREADVIGDLSTPGGRADASGATTELAGGLLDGVVCCAGVGPLAGQSGGLLTSVNYFGTVGFIEGVRDALVAAQSASVVVLSSSSTSTQPGIPEDLVALCREGNEAEAARLADELTAIPTYPASKLALAGWVRHEAVRPEWIGRGVRINAIAPGMIDTPMTSGDHLDPELAKALDFYPVPLGRRGRPEEVAALAEFLLGPGSTLLCGSVIFADGGTDAQLRADAWPAPWHPTQEELTRHFRPQT